MAMVASAKHKDKSPITPGDSLTQYLGKWTSKVKWKRKAWVPQLCLPEPQHPLSSCLVTLVTKNKLQEPQQNLLKRMVLMGYTAPDSWGIPPAKKDVFQSLKEC